MSRIFTEVNFSKKCTYWIWVLH